MFFTRYRGEIAYSGSGGTIPKEIIKEHLLKVTEPGQYRVGIRFPVGDKRVEKSALRYISVPPTLNTPQNVRWVGRTAKWDAVPGANKYEVELQYFNNHTRTITTQSTEWDWSDQFNIENTSYRFKVTALDTNFNANSSDPAYSQYQSIGDKLDTPSNLAWDGLSASWDSVPGATEYYITQYKNNVQYQILRFPSPGFNITGYEHGAEYWYTVQARSPNHVYSDVASGTTTRAPNRLTVVNGSGSGDYVLSSIVSVRANTISGKRFVRWESSTPISYRNGTNANQPNVDILMPRANLTLTAIFEDIPATVTGITVAPKSATVIQGGTHNFSATVEGTGNFNRSYSWSVSGNNSAGTSISAEGVLTVDPTETAPTLTVTATSNQDSSVRDSATVTITQLAAPTYTVTVVNGSGAGDYEEGEAVTLVANEAPAGKRFLKWIGVIGLPFTDGTNDLSPTLKFTMPAGSVNAEATYEDIPAPTITDVSVSPQTVSVAQGGTQAFSADISGTGDFDETVTWTMTGANAAGTSISAEGVLTVDPTETAPTLTVTATSNQDSSVRDSATVTITQLAAPTYTVTVVNGSGAGDYEEGEAVTLVANEAPAGKRFLKWIGVIGLPFTDGTNDLSPTLKFTMPAGSVNAEATYEDIPVTEPETPDPDPQTPETPGAGTVTPPKTATPVRTPAKPQTAKRTPQAQTQTPADADENNLKDIATAAKEEAPVKAVDTKEADAEKSVVETPDVEETSTNKTGLWIALALILLSAAITFIALARRKKEQEAA